jgi:predicted transcriptional regulator
MAKQSSAKQMVVDLVQEMPEDSSYDEILEELIMNRMIERGLADVEAGRTISDEEMAKTIESWQD